MLESLRLRARALFRTRLMERELDEELRYHLENEAARNVARGLNPADAAAAARRAFGNTTQLKEQVRDSWGRRWLERMTQDARYAWRSFRRAPGFAITVIATIALALGLNTTAFTIFDAYVLRPVAIRDPSSLYEIAWQSRNGNEHGFSWGDYQSLRSSRDALSESFAFRPMFARVDSAPMFGQLVSGNYFSMLGVGAALGRTLLASDVSDPGDVPVVVLSYAAWRSHFGMNSAIVGKRIQLRGHALQVVGVSERSFGGLGDVPMDFWAPVTMSDVLLEGDSVFGRREPEAFRIVGRLRTDVTPGQGEAWITNWIRDRRPAARRGDAPASATLISRATSIPLSPELLLFFTPIATAFVLVLLIACANVANMMLARGLARQRELGIRLSLGAARSRLVAQLVTEAVLLALPAAAIGFGLSRATIAGGVRLMFATLPIELGPYMRIVPLSPDTRIFLFMLVAAVSAALLFGLAPALQATRPNVLQTTRGDFDTQLRPSRLRSGLVIGQVTVCVLLLVCAGILLRGVGRMQQLDVGLRTHGVIRIDLQEKPGVRERVLQSLATIPQIRSIAAASDPPFGRRFPTTMAGPADGRLVPTFYDFVTATYFPLLEMPIVRGRNFTREEERVRAPVSIVSEGTARRLWPGADPIGQTLRVSIDTLVDRHPPLRASRTTTVVGIVANVAPGTVIDPIDAPMAYFPMSADSGQLPILVRVAGPQRIEVHRIDAALSQRVPSSIEDIHTVDDYMYGGIYPFRAAYWMAGVLGAIALLLTVAGVYGVLSYIVVQRRKEMGIRLALGALPSTVCGLVLGESLRLAGVGLGLGCLLAVGVARLFAANIVRMSTFEPGAFLGGAMLVLASCAVAGYVPARRASAVDPMEALRGD